LWRRPSPTIAPVKPEPARSPIYVSLLGIGVVAVVVAAGIAVGTAERRPGSLSNGGTADVGAPMVELSVPAGSSAAPR
jgi:hypothetical protein